MEYAPKGDLFDLLCNFNQMPIFLARSYARQMAEAIAYIHEEGIAHRDIKLENFLLDANFSIKLADFGAACKAEKGQLFCDKVGTAQYLAPEQHNNERYDAFEVDIFSLGVTIFTLVAGNMPFSEASKEEEFYVNFINESPEIFWDMHEELMGSASENPYFSKEFRDLINGMLCNDASQRMTIQEVLNHPWLRVKPECIAKSGEIVAEFYKKRKGGL